MTDFELHNPNLNEEDEESINNEIKRLLKRHTAQKKLISREANKDPAKLRHEDREEYIERVEGAIKKLKAPLDLYDAIYQRLNHLYTLLEELHDPEAKDAAKIKEELSKEIGLLNDEQTKYEEEIHAPAHCALRKILRNLKTQNGPSSTQEPTTTTSDKRWKPRDEYKPDRLHLSDRPTVLDTWISKLKSYLSGHEKQPHNDLYNLLDCLIDDEIKTAINFNRRDETPIFGENGNSLVEQILEIWKKEYPINKLRMALFEMKCGPSEDWNSWEAKMKEEASKADLNALKGEDILALLIIMKYEGPHATKIKSELSKKANSSDEKEICLLQARKIYSDEKYSSRFVTPSTVKQITPQQGGKNPNRGQKQTNDKGSTRSGYAVYNQNQTRSGTSRKGIKFMDTEKAKEMVKEGRCTRCYKQNCPGKAKDKECPDIKTLSCTYCKKLNKIGTGHVEDACVTKWIRENNQQGASIRQIFNEVSEEEEQK